MVWANPGRDQTRQIAISDMLGEDTADNTQATTLVAANADGSLVERLEYIQTQAATLTTNLAAQQAAVGTTTVYNPFLGYGVTKVSNLADGAGTDNLFTVTGRCLITCLTGEVTTVIGGAATMKLTDVTNTVDLCAATTIDTDAVGTMYALTQISASVLNGTGMTPVVGSVPNLTGSSDLCMKVIGDAQAALTIAHVLDAADTGAVTWRLYYWPLISGATIEAAA